MDRNLIKYEVTEGQINAIADGWNPFMPGSPEYAILETILRVKLNDRLARVEERLGIE